MIKKFEEFIFESYNCENFKIRKRSSLIPLNESQESESQKSAIKLVMDRFGWDKEKANHFVRVDLRNDITSLRDKQIGKFTLGVTRMYADGELNDANTISDINATLKLLSAHLNEYDRNLNGLSADELISKFKKVRENNVEMEKREISKMKFGVSDYEIIKIDSFNDAKKYYKYTNPSSRWCLTHMEDMYDSYTCGGINQIYFCLRNGFENIKPTVGKNTPLDEYGLSMLSIIVNENGELAYCTCRWNHDNEGNDSVMDAVEISEVVNVNFYEVFKPNTKWKDMIDDVKNRLANGESLKEVFNKVIQLENGINIVKLKGKNGRYNLINSDGDFLSDKWFDYVYDYFEDSYVKVELNQKYNFINKNGEYLFDKWFDNVSYFEDGYVKVKLNDKYNFINKNGEYLSDKWFGYVYDFDDGYARVELDSKYNFINKNGEILSDEWFDNAYDFNDGYAKVKLNQKYNFINKNGEILSDEWFDNAYDFKEGFGIVKSNHKYNFINKNGEILSDKWFDYVYNFKEGFAKVELNQKYNFINKNGEILSDKWFGDADYFEGGFAKVVLNNKHYTIDTYGVLH